MSTSFEVLALDLGPRQAGGELDARGARARRVLDRDHRVVHAQQVPGRLLGDRVVLENRAARRGRAIDVVLELGQKLERLGAIDVDRQRQVDLAATRARAKGATSASGLPLLPAVLQKAVKEFLGRKYGDLAAIAIAAIAVVEADLAALTIEKAMIADGHAMRVRGNPATPRPGKRGLRIDHPLFLPPPSQATVA